MSLTISFLSGIIAAFTPCVIVLMPILLYRFFHEDKKEWRDFSLFIVGFIISYIIFGYFLSSLFTSVIQNGVKVGLGLFFIILGILAVLEKLNPLNFPIIKNSLLLGGIFALIISFNPCTIPYLGFILSISNSGLLFLNMAVYGLGLIFPAILFAFFGNKILHLTKKSGKIFYTVNKLMHYILILSGVYLIFTIKRLEIYDIFVISFFLFLSFFILLRAFFIINEKKDFLKIKNLLLIISLMMIIFVSITHCSYQVESQNKVNEILGIKIAQSTSCSQDVTNCSVCLRCIYTFGAATLIGLVGIFLVGKER